MRNNLVPFPRRLEAAPAPPSRRPRFSDLRDPRPPRARLGLGLTRAESYVLCELAAWQRGTGATLSAVTPALAMLDLVDRVLGDLEELRLVERVSGGRELAARAHPIFGTFRATACGLAVAKLDEALSMPVEHDEVLCQTRESAIREARAALRELER